MKKTLVLTIASAAVIAAVLAAGWFSAAAGSKEIPLKPLKAEGDLAARFGRYYQPVVVKIEPKVPAYSLPLTEKDIQNLADVLAKAPGAKKGLERLLATGLTSVDFGAQDDVVAAYKWIKQTELPVFVTSDSTLHLYHIQFDETLRQIEEKEFYPDMIGLSKAFQQEFADRYDDADGLEKEAMKKALAYFSVGLKLLDPKADAPRPVRDPVDEEIKLIEAHAGFKESPIFTYKEDYSQYVPRGHYTRSETLKRYFKAMMWYGRLTMLIKGHKDFGPEAQQPALVSEDEAKAQTIAACAIAALLPQLQVGDRGAQEIWERVYAVTAYYVGLADDLTAAEYLEAVRATSGDRLKLEDLAADANFLKLKTELAKLRPPAIYSGTGESAVNLDLEPGRQPTPEQLDRILGKTQGFRLLGQRYVPDSFILGQMVVPTIGPGGGPQVFTTVVIPDYGQVRGFPRGLDVMAVLGSNRALEHLRKLGDAGYERYDQTLEKLRAQFAKPSPADWNRNLYWSWLYALKGLLEPAAGPGWPTFMAGGPWLDKQLNAALGSWSSLRHDTILYAKQSYTPTLAPEAAPPPPPDRPVVGYVEPVPEFYARLVALTRMTIKGLGEMKVLDAEAMGRLTSLEAVLSRLLAISEKELANEALGPEDYAFIKDFGESLSNVVAGANADAQKTTLVADVHTDQNTKQVLEEGTGHLRLLLVAYKLPQGHVLVGAGPAFSYYEFKHPMADRLTDEKWRELLQSDKRPELPSWTDSFAAK